MPPRRTLLLCCLLAALVAALWLKLTPASLWPSGAGWKLFVQFFGQALTPAWDYENRDGLPADAPCFLYQLGNAALATLRFALAAVSLSLVGGLILGFLGSRVWWPERRGRGAAQVAWWLARSIMTLLRSVHELIWATLLLAAFGLSPLIAVIAIALPYAGTLAKVFAEMAEEMDAPTQGALRTLGASPAQFFSCGVLPRIRAELLSYSLYRFECGLRSAAILGFIGLPGLGLMLSLSYENLHYREVWSTLYALLALVLCFDFLSSWVRRRLVSGGTAAGGKDWRLRGVFVLLGIGILWAWLGGEFFTATASSGQRWANFERFCREVLPWPLQQGESWSSAWPWLLDLLFGEKNQAWLALLNTLAISAAAIVLAALGGLLLMPWATRTLATPRPFLPEGASATAFPRALWAALYGFTRLVLILARSIPEYIWAFLFVGMFPNQFWAAILALALHNAGILGRLGAEIAENADPASPEALRGLGATRRLLATAALAPAGFSRFLVYFFYRWETCLREGTVLGMLGVLTLGRLIKDARAFGRHDEMLLFILLGAILVLGGDLVSNRLRRFAEKAAEHRQERSAA